MFLVIDYPLQLFLVNIITILLPYYIHILTAQREEYETPSIKLISKEKNTIFLLYLILGQYRLMIKNRF